MLRALVAASVISGPWFAGAAVPAVDTGPGRAAISTASRLPWTRGTSTVVRQWLTLGPLTAAEAAALQAAVPPAYPGAEQAVGAGRTLRWQFQSGWSDVVELAPPLLAEAPDAEADQRRFILAYASVERPEAAEVEFSLGADAPVAVAVNGGDWGTDLPPGPVLTPDQHQLRVALRAGTNHVLVRLEANRSRPNRLLFRIDPPGMVRAPAAEITPWIEDGDGDLVVWTNLQPANHAAPVQVRVSGPGGAVVGEVILSRGEAARFRVADWAQGPYEIRCVTETAWGERRVVHLPWFHGDLLRMAQELVDRKQDSANNGTDAATRALLVELIRNRLEAAPLADLDRAEQVKALHAPLMEWAELELERQGTGSRIRPGGFYRIAYVSDVDGSVQFGRAYLPPDYDPARRWPLVVSLHGFNPVNPPYSGWWSVDRRHDERADRFGVIVIEPHGRGNAQYMGIGEDDVLRVLDEAMARFSVDEDRVYLTGESMGGSGTWIIGSRHPERFAALAPVYGGWDFRVAPPSGGDPRPAVPQDERENFRLEQRSSFVGAEQLLNVPVLVHHGDDDRAVSVENSRHITRQLQRWGYNVRYHEMPGRGHDDLGVAGDIVAWMLEHRRQPAPRRVRVRSADLRGAAAHWVRVQGFVDPLTLIEANGEMVEPGILRLDTANVAQVQLTPPPELLDVHGGLRVIWNGQEVWSGPADAGAVMLPRPGETLPEVLRKRPGLGGPIPDLIRTPFIVVWGTSSDDPAMRRRCREKAEAFRALWSRWQHHAPRIVEDVALTESDFQRYSLLLIGGADANRVTQRLAGRLPFRVESDRITVDGKSWTAPDAVAEMIYPHPENPQRYVLVVAGTSAAGLYFWNPSLTHPVLGFSRVPWDWVIQDGRRLEPGVGEARDGVIAAGVFDAAWRREERWTTEGDAELRANSPLRHAPADGYTPASDVLARCAGVYEIVPGVVMVVAAREAGLELSVMGDPPVRLLPESEWEYAREWLGLPVVFERDAGGHVVAVLLYDDAGVMRARRLEK